MNLRVKSYRWIKMAPHRARIVKMGKLLLSRFSLLSAAINWDSGSLNDKGTQTESAIGHIKWARKRKTEESSLFFIYTSHGFPNSFVPHWNRYKITAYAQVHLTVRSEFSFQLHGRFGATQFPGQKNPIRLLHVMMADFISRGFVSNCAKIYHGIALLPLLTLELLKLPNGRRIFLSEILVCLPRNPVFARKFSFGRQINLAIYIPSEISIGSFQSLWALQLLILQLSLPRESIRYWVGDRHKNTRLIIGITAYRNILLCVTGMYNAFVVQFYVPEAGGLTGKYCYYIIRHRMKIQCMTSRVFAAVHPLSNIVVFLFSVLNNTWYPWWSSLAKKKQTNNEILGKKLIMRHASTRFVFSPHESRSIISKWNL